MHREAFRTWEERKSGSGSDSGDTSDGIGSVASAGKETGGGGGCVASGGVGGEGGSAAGEGESEKAAGGAGAGAKGDTPAAGGASGFAGAGAAAGGGGSGSGARARPAMDESKVHIFTSHFFTKLTEGGKSCSSQVSQSAQRRVHRFNPLRFSQS